MGLNLSKYWNYNLTDINTHKEFLQFICVVVDEPFIRFPEIQYPKLEIKESTIDSMLKERNKGLFTKNALTENTPIMIMNITKPCMMNDAMVDLTEILSAKNNVQMYDAWKHLHANYHNIEKAKDKINVRMVKYNNDKFVYVTMKDVAAGEELLRSYGFTTWCFELFDIFSDHNIIGFAKFINELNGTIVGDPFQQQIETLNDIFTRYYLNLGYDLSSADIKQMDSSINTNIIHFLQHK